MIEQSLMARNLVYFMALYRIRKYAEAAQSIPITYQGLKKSMRALQTELGVPLFEPAGEGQVTPTPYADALFETALAWVHDARSLSKTFDQLGSDGRETVDIAVVQGFKEYLGEDVGSRFERANPGLVLDMAQYPDSSIDDFLREGIFDLAVISQPFDDDFEVVHLTTWDHCVWVHRDHPKSRLDRITLADLEGEDVMIPDGHFKTHALFVEAQEKGLVNPRSVSLCSHMSASYLYALQGRGIGVGVMSVPDAVPNIDEVVTLPFDNGFTHGIYLARRRGYELAPKEEALVKFLIAEAERKRR